MNQRHVVALSLLWVLALVAVSRSWVGDAKNYVQQVTGNASG